MLKYSIIVILLVTLTGAIFKQDNFRKNQHSSSTQPIISEDSIAIVGLLDPTVLHIHFCGDTMPLTDPAIARRYLNALDKYDFPAFSRYKSRMTADLKVIGQILNSHQIPADFKYVPVVESYFVANAVSPKGAAGYWQLMPETAKALGLRVDETVDERTDLLKSTHAAAKYLKWLYGQLGDWTLVAAAYNIGPGRLIRHMDSQKKNSFYQLRLNSETSKYVYQLVAVKEWFSRPDRCASWVEEGFLVRLAQHQDHHRVYHEVIPKGNVLVQAAK